MSATVALLSGLGGKYRASLICSVAGSDQCDWRGFGIR